MLDSWDGDVMMDADASRKRYKVVKVHPSALLKLMRHADLGEGMEVMGILIGRVSNLSTAKPEFIVLDLFELPIDDSTATRISGDTNSDIELVEFCMVQELLRQSDDIRPIGWYHTHPGYKAWLSSIDVNTQNLYQQHQDPWVALVYDPDPSSLDRLSAHDEAPENQPIVLGAFRIHEPNFPHNLTSFVPDLDTTDSASKRHHTSVVTSVTKKYYSIPIQIWTPEQQAPPIRELRVNLNDLLANSVSTGITGTICDQILGETSVRLGI